MPCKYKKRGEKWPEMTDEQRDLVARNIGTAGMIAGGFWRRQKVKALTFEELLSAGRMGLIEASYRYDKKRKDPATGEEIKFTSYATWWIKDAIVKEFYKNRLIGLPYHVRRRKAAARYRALADQADRVISLDALGDDGHELIGDYRGEGPESSRDDGISHAGLAIAMESLTPRQREIVRRRSEGETLDQIGREIGITKEGVRQAYHRAIGHLRSSMGVAVPAKKPDRTTALYRAAPGEQ